MGVNNPHRKEIEYLTSSMKQVSCYCNVKNMAELLANSDLYVGAAGTTTWERCCLGVPSLVITTAENQVHATQNLAEAGIITFVGKSHLVKHDHIANAVCLALHSPGMLKMYSDASLALVDGLGARRCADRVMSREIFLISIIVNFDYDI
jgi:spore coat polysaccharide biosynthesis predicted glycosyltransferase SpsG